jgi:arylsulfatase A-like enzyme/Flp pilus assembly protein TadD
MTRRGRGPLGRVRALALAASFAASCGGEAVPAPRPDAPSVLLISIDTLRADRVGAYGAPFGATPRLDALAREGLRCEKAIAPAPLTLPSHATLMTGLYPPRHGVRHNGIFRLADEHVTVAERFAEAGYATGAVVGAVVLDRSSGLAQGFGHYDDAIRGERANSTGFVERKAAEVSAAAQAWLASTPGPFFLFVHYYDPHANYQPPPEFAARFPRLPYEGEIAAVDDAVGRLLDALRAAGRLESTIVAVTADHGESLFEHGERTHSYTLYDATLSVPLVLAGPGVPRGGVVPGIVSTASMAPTLLRLAGLPALPDVDGEDLLARSGAAEAPAGEAYAETLATQLDQGWAPLYALRTEAHHYVRAPRPELYAVGSDPREVENLLADGRRPEADALDTRIAAILEQGQPLRAVAIDAETKEQLRALGYALAEEPRAATEIDPKDGLPIVEAYVEARRALLSDDLDGAEARARSLLDGPGAGQGHVILAGVAVQRGDASAALRHAEEAARLLPPSAQSRTQIGDLRLDLGDFAGALAAYEAALTINPAHPEALAGAMWRAKGSGDLAAAEETARRALAARPNDVALRQRVAENWDRLAAAEAALAAYRAVLELVPDDGAAHMGAAIQLARLARDEEAAAQLAAAGAYASEPNHRNRLAIVYAARGENARAEALFRELLAAFPEHRNARRNLAHLLRTTGRPSEAAQLEAEAPPTKS